MATLTLEADTARTRDEVSRQMWVVLVAGIPTGVVVAGLGSRLAMLVLRLTSSPSVKGVTSDDGFEIGRLTMSGTYNLLLLGAAVGVIGALAYRAVAPWLLGPCWFRRATVSAGSGVVVGSMLVHDEGIDFHLLTPQWLAISLFVALPALFGLAIASAVDRVSAVQAPTRWRRWRLPAVLVVAFPLAIPIVVIALAVTIGRVGLQRRFGTADRQPLALGLVVRSAWLAIAVFGLAALVADVRALA